ncbi:MAG: flagellar basal body rod protein FlgC [Negativicutes bacterium]|jgi:flagellar basal-body rod protein FlgC|nr:flagellar basal body rod protein FlgC [Negativicutes bacterium]
MSMFGAIDASASGLTAERLRMDVISNNIANANTTRTVEGGPYKRKIVTFEERDNQGINSFSQILSKKMKTGSGVRATGIIEDGAPGKLVYDPNHPDANKEGYVELPNLNIVSEMVDMITATRAYEANTTAINSAKSMAMKALEIGRG